MKRPELFGNTQRVGARRAWRMSATLAILIWLFLALPISDRVSAQGPAPSANVSTFATGFDNPRGLKFGPDGTLYVAEGGSGGPNSAVGKCDQVPTPVGPYTGSKTGARISKVGSDGKRIIAVDNLPSSQTTAASGSLVSGVADVAFVGNTLYALLNGAGCSHGVPEVPNALIKGNGDGTWAQVADLGAFQKANPVAKPEKDDFEPDGTWNSLVAIGTDLYALEPNHGELDKITSAGQVSRVIDISASQGHVVPTAMVVGPDGNFYVGNLSLFPVQQGKSNIYKITPGGQISVFASGLTTVLGLAFDAQGRLYALEMSAGVTDPKGPPVVPFSGRVVRVTSPNKLEPVATGLMFPTAMTFGADGKLYVSNCGFGCPPGKGEIVRVDVSAPATLPKTGDDGSSLTIMWLALLGSAGLILAGWYVRKGIGHD